MNFKLFYKFAFWTSLIGILAFFTDFGFAKAPWAQSIFNIYYIFVLILGVVTTVIRYLDKKSLPTRGVFIFDLLSILFTLVIIGVYFFGEHVENPKTIFNNDNWIKFAVLLTFIREFSEVKLNYKRTLLNPAQLFVASFLGMILLGSLLLMLPKATYEGLSFIDALFTSTSAVCVTGLIVVDTGTYFTEFGQIIIMILIQIGGLGILTFASYFSYFFKGGATYENQLALSDMTNSRKLSDVFSTLKYVLLITFTIEIFSGILIYSSLDGTLFVSQTRQIFFAIFHAISAFCNAGFSTLTNSLYEEGFRYNYYLHLTVILSFVLGGLGFPIVANIVKYLKYRARKLLFLRTKKVGYRPWVLHLTSRVTLVTTFTLMAIGFIAFYIFEYNNTLSEHRGFGKVVTALFGATTPRTAGFNTIDTAAMAFPTLMIVLLLMWIGASPASTGGGIKTSTFAIATLNILSLAKGKTRIEVYRREIADISVRRAFAIIGLSLMVIGLAILVISMNDPRHSLMSIAFECFSAYSTVGLSLGITPDLSNISKLVIIITMFVGRVGMLSVIIALFRPVKHKNYRYPSEEILMN